MTALLEKETEYADLENSVNVTGQNMIETPNKETEPQTLKVRRVSIDKAEAYIRSFGGKKVVLEKLGIFGWEDLELPLLIFLLLGKPVILTGEQGSAKSLAPKRLAAALGVVLRRYDLAKSMFEDVIGMPDARALMSEDRPQGKFPRIETSNTIWEGQFLQMDEINRCAPDLQSKWLEMLVEGLMMGESTPVRWIMGSMNPLKNKAGESFAGTQAMDIAFVSRFMLYLNVPNSGQIKEDTFRMSIEHSAEDDAPALSVWNNYSLTPREDGLHKMNISQEGHYQQWQPDADFIEGSEYLRSLLVVAALKKMPTAEKNWGEGLTKFLYAVNAKLWAASGKTWAIDMRRLKMIRHAYLAGIALEEARLDTDMTAGSLFIMIRKLTTMMLPFEIQKLPITLVQLNEALDGAKNFLINKVNPLYQIHNEPRPIEKLILMLSFKNLTQENQEQAINNIGEILLEDQKSTQETEPNKADQRTGNKTTVRQAALALGALSLRTQDPGLLPESVWMRTMDALTRWLGSFGGNSYTLTSGQLISQTQMLADQTATGALASQLALRLFLAEGKLPTNIDTNEFFRLKHSLVAELTETLSRMEKIISG